MPQTLSLNDILKPEDLAAEIANKFILWQAARNPWRTNKDELLAYLFATDTSHTSAITTPWKNKTTRPKLCQIRDNLHANYINALFPTSNWLTWLPYELTDDWVPKKTAILQYVYSKINHPESKFYETVSRLVLDYIDYGQVFSIGNNYYAPWYQNDESVVLTYQGPRLNRLSPMDIVMDPSAKSAEAATKIHREMVSIGDLHAMLQEEVSEYNKSAIKRTLAKRKELMDSKGNIGDIADEHVRKQYTVAGFGSPELYFNSDMVEILTLYGSIYDIKNRKFHHNRVIKVMDRANVVMNIPNPTTNGSPIIRTVGWRLRPDMLWAMGPLDNLVGMQYRIDHLENLRADAFDHIAFPTKLIKGDTVSEIKGQPGEHIYVDTDSDVSFLNPDTTALHADIQIRQLEEAMEEYAGAPRQAMGIRTPGEKTKFEVQTLENNAGRVFQLKAAWFESQHLEPALNDMLDGAARNIGSSGEKFVYKDPVSGLSQTVSITKEDLNLKGVLRPMGARHFAEKANRFQSMIQYQQMVRPEVWRHFDDRVWATIDADSLDLTRYGVLRDVEGEDLSGEVGNGSIQNQPPV